MPDSLLQRYLEPLVAGRRRECFELISAALNDGATAGNLLADVVWPALEHVERLFRSDRLSHATEHAACLINRTVSDQLQARLPAAPPNGRRVVVTCADSESEELGGQITSDLLQADGWEVFFIGAGGPHDEILSLIGQLRPDILVIFGAQPDDVPNARRLVEMIREVGVCPTMNIVASGGIFNRADGLWQEVGADVLCPTPQELPELLRDLPPREPTTVVRIGVVKRRRRKRKDTPASLATTAGAAR
ncbi:B12 binding domain protein [Phycisphaerae bacterium RAS1]|nr:B12 binding domain protein [Phycisphaerae bacterium RAS1]